MTATCSGWACTVWRSCQSRVGAGIPRADWCAESRAHRVRLPTDRSCRHHAARVLVTDLCSLGPLPPPSTVLVEVVQDACALLECRQPLELCAAIRPVQELAALVPRMVRAERQESLGT